MMLLLLLLATSFLTLLYICHFNFLTSLFALSGCIPSYALGTVLLVTLEHPIFFWAAVICTVSSCFTNFVSLPIPVLHIPAWVQSHYSGYIFGSCRQRASLLGSHPSCLRVLYPFLLFLLSMCAIPFPDSSLLRYLYAKVYTGRRSDIYLLNSIWMLPDSPFLRDT